MIKGFLVLVVTFFISGSIVAESLSFDTIKYGFELETKITSMNEKLLFCKTAIPEIMKAARKLKDYEMHQHLSKQKKAIDEVHLYYSGWLLDNTTDKQKYFTIVGNQLNRTSRQKVLKILKSKDIASRYCFNFLEIEGTSIETLITNKTIEFN